MDSTPNCYVSTVQAKEGNVMLWEVFLAHFEPVNQPLINHFKYCVYPFMATVTSVIIHYVTNHKLI